ncbi:RAC-alpha serine/threonine-protein kinase [Salvia divinorum]|uniref:RAC-alpha serine/threonine-protein kinase n=1 Tax=Salvia divinorum TaxID=28513 RepID=A0ABD1GUU3_SALDI
MAMTTAAAAVARHINNAKINRRSSGLSSSSYDGFYRNDAFLSSVSIITITCLDVDAVGRLLVVPSSMEELKHVGMTLYGATFYRVLLDNEGEINDIRVVRSGDVIVFAEEPTTWVTITITCLEKGDVSGKPLVVPRTFEELKQVGVKVYGAHFARVLDKQGTEINDVGVLRNGDRIVYASQKRDEESNARAMIMFTITCLEKGDSARRLLVLPFALGQAKLKVIGGVIYGAIFHRVMDEKGVEINDIRVLRNGDRVIFARENRKWNAQKWVEESNAHIRVEELNAQKWVEGSNAPVTVTCLTPIMRVLREMW